MASRLPILPRTKRVRCDENQESTEKKRFRASSPDKDPPVVRVAASIATSRLRAPPVAAMPRAQVIGRQSLAPIRPKNRMPAVVSAGVAQSAPAGDKRKRAAWDLKGQVTDMRDKVNNFKDKVQGLSGENQRLQLSAGQMRRNLEALTCENTKLSQANCALELELQAAQQKLTVSEAEMGRLSGLCVRQEAELRSLNHTVEELQEANGGLAQLLQVKEVKLACSESEVTKLRGIVREQSEDLTSCRRTVAARDAQVHALETERRRLHNLVQELKGNIRVFCRVRPALHTEETLPASHISFPKGDEQCIVLSKTEESHVGRERKDAVKYDFSFDCVFPPSCGQPAVFEEIELLVQVCTCALTLVLTPSLLEEAVMQNCNCFSRAVCAGRLPRLYLRIRPDGQREDLHHGGTAAWLPGNHGNDPQSHPPNIPPRGGAEHQRVGVYLYGQLPGDI
ncbi:hypothetical protein FKM82_027902 [Ascaphus truei]